MFESFVDPIKVEKAKKEGMLVGKREGIREGKQAGKREGIQVGKQEEKLHMSKKLFELGMDIDTIKEVTGLTKEELEMLMSSEQ